VKLPVSGKIAMQNFKTTEGTVTLMPAKKLLTSFFWGNLGDMAGVGAPFDSLRSSSLEMRRLGLGTGIVGHGAFARMGRL